MSGEQDPVAWLRAAVTADLELARRVKARYIVPADHPMRAGEHVWPTAVVRKAWEAYGDPDVRAGLDLVLAHGPQWVIDDAEAKLAVLDEHAPVHGYDPYCPVCAVCGDAGRVGDEVAVVPHPCRTVRLLGQGYRSRPGYREEDWPP